ncbi:MAG: hypothetical protein J6T94_06740 [Bacteroidaceae bacterium]|nr:hypothetical protein [Bacteroidaceae bacterium]
MSEEKAAVCPRSLVGFSANQFVFFGILDGFLWILDGFLGFLDSFLGIMDVFLACCLRFRMCPLAGSSVSLWPTS